MSGFKYKNETSNHQRRKIRIGRNKLRHNLVRTRAGETDGGRSTRFGMNEDELERSVGTKWGKEV